MAQPHALSIERREGGTTASRALRRAGKVPGVIYGHGSQAESIAMEAKALDDLLHHAGKSALIALTLGGKRFDTAMVRELAYDPVSRRVIHVDMQRVTADETVHAKLPVIAAGTPEGVRNAGGVMDVLAHELEVEGPANRLPEHIEIDVRGLDIHQHVTAGDVALPKGLRMITSAETVVVAVEPSKTARMLEEAEAPTLEGAEPELVGRTETAE